MATVELQGLTKVYSGDVTAVSDMNLNIVDGELVVFVGPSGCGKSTALRMIAGLEEITDGTLRIGDEDMTGVHPRERDIAMVFQNYALYPHLTVRNNIAYPLKLARVGKSEIAKRVERTAEILQLSELLDRKPAALSGGQRQRVAMGRAIVREPAVFLMDEPLSNLDAKLRVYMRSEISRIQRELGVTTIYVTHDQVEAMTMGDRVAVLKGGVLQQADRPSVLYHNPANLFVAGFIGSPAMNIFEASISVGSDSVVVEAVGLEAGGVGAEGQEAEGQEAEGQEVEGQEARGIETGRQTFEVPLEVLSRLPALREFDGARVACGIRPENVHDAKMTSEFSQRLNAKVMMVEELGSEIVVHLDVGLKRIDSSASSTDGEEDEGATYDTGFLGRLSHKSAARAGEEIEVSLDVSALHFFDLTTGQSINN